VTSLAISENSIHHVAVDVDPVVEIDQLDTVSRHSETRNCIFEFVHSSGVIVSRFVESASVYAW
jgi:hypothetical protein